MKSSNQEMGKILIVLLMTLVAVNTELTCLTLGNTDVTCTAGDTDFILERGLVSDNNLTTRITLKSCRITKVDFEAFEHDDNLKYIDLSINKFDKLELGVLDGNLLVTHLNLSNNILVNFPLGLFDQKPNLEVLDLKSNKINALELGVFDPLVKLVYLDLSNNALIGKDIDPYIFDKTIKIRFIDFSRNNMSGAPENLLHALTELHILNLERCSLKEMPTFATKLNLKTMKQLVLSSNEITKIDQPGTFINLENLEILNLAENAIDVLATDVFKPLKKLKTVSLRSNRLKVMPDSLFFNLITLASVDLSYNLIEYIPVNALRGTSIKNLNLSHNKFSYLEANFCLELKNSGVRLNKFYFNDNPWQCACLNEILNEVKIYNIKYNSAKYNGNNRVCVTTTSFICKRQMAENELFIDMYERKKENK